MIFPTTTKEPRLIIVIDIGNSNIVLGCFDHGTLKAKWRFSTHPIGTADEFIFKLDKSLQSQNLTVRQIDSFVISSVVPFCTPVIEMATRSLGDSIKVHIVDSTWPFSFRIGTQYPAQSGTDLLANAEAAIQKYGHPVLIVDMGTATTFTTVVSGDNGKPVYVGGAIMPGVETSMKALAQNTAQLPLIALKLPEKAVGRNTLEALQSGILLGHASMVDGMLKKFKNELNLPNLKVVATGGNSNHLKDFCPDITYVEPDLTLNGLALLYNSVSRRK